MNALDLSHYSDSDVLRIYSEVMEELQRRGVIHSTNNPVANLAESLACKTLSLKAMPESTKGYDAIDGNNLKYEVKGRRPTAKNKSRQLSFIRELDKRHFDFLVGVIFNENLTVMKSCLVPHDIVFKRAVYTKHGNAWIFQLRDEIWNLEGVRDLTEEMKMAEKGAPVERLSSLIQEGLEDLAEGLTTEIPRESS